MILWELASGQRLFKGLPDVAILHQVDRGYIPRPSTQNPDVDPGGGAGAVALGVAGRSAEVGVDGGVGVEAAPPRSAREEIEPTPRPPAPPPPPPADDIRMNR